MSHKFDLAFARRNILAPDHPIGGGQYFCADVVTLGTFSEGAYRRLNMSPDLDWKKFECVILDVPAILTRNTNAPTPSIFKRAAALTISFIKNSPLDIPFPLKSFPKPLAKITNHQNAIVAFEYSRQCLHQAAYRMAEGLDRGRIVILRNRIKVSAHFYYDLVHALANIKSADECFHLLSLLYESLAYKSNRGASYPEVI